MELQLVVFIIIFPIIYGNVCVPFNFEEGFESFDPTLGNVCGSINNNWILTPYSSVDILPPDPRSEKHITSSAPSSCVSSFFFYVEDGGTVEVNVFMVFNEFLTLGIYNEGNQQITSWTSFANPITANSWVTVRFPLNTVEQEPFRAYLSIFSTVSVSGTILIDSFRYIPPGYDENNSECVIYDIDDNATTESGTTDHDGTTDSEDVTSDSNSTTESGTTDNDGTTEGVTTDSDSTTEGITTDSDSTTEGVTTDNDSTTEPGTTDYDGTTEGVTDDSDSTTEPGTTDYDGTTEGVTDDSDSTTESGTTDFDGTTEGVTTDNDSTTETGTTDFDGTTESGTTDYYITTEGETSDSDGTTASGTTNIDGATETGTTDNDSTTESISTDPETTDDSTTDVDSVTEDPSEVTTEDPYVDDDSSFWTPLNIALIATGSFIVLLIIIYIAYWCGKRREKNKIPEILYLDIDEIPKTIVVPRVKKVYTDSVNSNPYSRDYYQ